jgi:chromosome segregation ATPase
MFTPEIQAQVDALIQQVRADEDQKRRSQEKTFIETLTALRAQRDTNADTVVQLSVQIAALLDFKGDLEKTITALENAATEHTKLLELYREDGVHHDRELNDLREQLQSLPKIDTPRVDMLAGHSNQSVEPVSPSQPRDHVKETTGAKWYGAVRDWHIIR